MWSGYGVRVWSMGMCGVVVKLGFGGRYIWNSYGFGV